MGDIRNDVVSAIQGNPFSPNTPLNGQWYIWNASTNRFELMTLTSMVLDSLTVENISGSPQLTLSANIISQNIGGGDYILTIDSVVGLSLTVPATDISPSAAGPTNPTTPAGFTKETVNGVVSWRPFYQ